jgi:hypothetical protein
MTIFSFLELVEKMVGVKSLNPCKIVPFMGCSDSSIIKLMTF